MKRPEQRKEQGASRLAAACLGLTVARMVAADSFVLDPPSPSVGPTAARILHDQSGAGGSPPPNVALGYSRLGLQPGDVIAAISDGQDEWVVPLDHDHLFSVQRCSQGAAGTGVAQERVADTPPGASPGHASDIFLWQLAYPGANVLAPAGMGWTQGTTDGDEANTNLVTTSPADNVNGYDESTMLPLLPPPDIGFEVYFTLAAGSPTLLANGWSAADILGVGGVFGTTPQLYLSAAALGLPVNPPPEINSLSLKTEVDPPWEPFFQAVEFTLRSSCGAISVTLAGSGDVVTSGAEIIRSDGAGGAWIEHYPVDLGLLADDDIDGLESIEPTGGADPCVRADLNGDGCVNTGDLLILLSCPWGSYSPCPPYDACDIDEDCNVGTSDLLFLLSCWNFCY